MRVQGSYIRHENPEIDLLHGYVESAVAALASRGIDIERCWLDPMGPRDATILFTSADVTHALVWDEWTGWRTGGYRTGHQGERTVLDTDAVHLGDGVLLDPRELAEHLISGKTAPARRFRGPAQTRDGLDDALRRWNHERA